LSLLFHLPLIVALGSVDLTIDTNDNGSNNDDDDDDDVFT